MSASLLIIGAGGHGRVVADTAWECGYERIGFLDDNHASMAEGGDAEIVGPMSMMGGLVENWAVAIAAVGDNTVRLELFQKLHRFGFKTPAIIHPSAVVSRAARIAQGVFIAAGAIVSTGARIGEAAIVNTGARIDHDCIIGKASHIAPGATLSGNVTTGVGAWLGTGCSVRQGVEIGDGAVVGVGAAVVGNLASRMTYVGVPTRPIAKK